MGDSMWVNGVNLENVEDEIELHKLLDSCDDFDERKKIRSRLKDVMAKHRAEREEMIRRREEDREGLLRKKVEDADELKRRTLAMYDAMAKSAPAGAQKSIDVNILRTGEITPTGYATPQEKRLDLVEDAIRARARDADERKKKVLAAYDKAAKSGPAGSVKFVDFDNVKPEDISNLENKQPKYSATFEMRGGIPLAPKVSVPRVAPRQVAPERDLMEESIRKRQAEAEERKRRTLAAYDQAARSRPAGTPINVYIPQTFDVEPVVSVVESPKIGIKPGQKASEIVNPTPRPPLAQQQQYQQQQYIQQQYQQQQYQQQPPTKPPPTGRSSININTQSIRTVSNPYENARPKPFVNQNEPQSSTRTVVTTQKTVTPLVQQQQQQRTVTITSQSQRTVQQQRQQQYYEEDEEEEEEEEEEEDY